MDEPLPTLGALAEGYAFQLASINMPAHGAVADADALAGLCEGEEQPTFSHPIPPPGRDA